MIPVVPLFGVPVGPELFVIVGVIVLLFGAQKLPELARAAGQSMTEFRRGREESGEEDVK